MVIICPLKPYESINPHTRHIVNMPPALSIESAPSDKTPTKGKESEIPSPGPRFPPIRGQAICSLAQQPPSH